MDWDIYHLVIKTDEKDTLKIKENGEIEIGKDITHKDIMHVLGMILLKQVQLLNREE